MHIIPCTFTDFDGNKREEKFYFNLTEYEFFKFNICKPGGLEAYVRKIVETFNVVELMDTFEQLINLSYGEKSADGREFVKNDKILERFKSTDAYSQILMQLVTDSDYAAKFVNGLVTPDTAAKVAELTGDDSDSDKPELSLVDNDVE